MAALTALPVAVLTVITVFLVEKRGIVLWVA